MRKTFYFIVLIVILAGCADEATKKYCEKDSDCVFEKSGDSGECFNIEYKGAGLDVFAEHCFCDTEINQCKTVRSDPEKVKNLG